MLEAISSFDGLTEDWTRLAQQTGSIFSTWEWNSLWWKYFGRGRELMTMGCRDEAGNLVAILPLYRSKERPLRIIRFLGHGQGDHLGPICAPADRDRTARALHEALVGRRFDLLIGDKMPPEPGWSARLGTRMLKRTPSPVLRFQGRSWDELLKARSANFREQVRRKERKLAREHELEYRFCDDPARLDDHIDTLFRLHLARWGESGSWLTGAEAFHREFASRALERGWLRLWLLELDGRPVAAWYGFRFGGAELYYQAGRDPAWERGSVGFVLLAHSIRAAIEDGADEYWFLEGSEGFKYRFASDDPGLETIAIPGSLRGRAAVAAASMLARGGAFSKFGRRLAD